MSPDGDDPTERAMTRLREHVRIAEGPGFYLRQLIRLRGDEAVQGVAARQISRCGADGEVSGSESATVSTNLRRLVDKGLVERVGAKPARYRLSRQAEEWIAVA